MQAPTELALVAVYAGVLVWLGVRWPSQTIGLWIILAPLFQYGRAGGERVYLADQALDVTPMLVLGCVGLWRLGCSSFAPWMLCPLAFALYLTADFMFGAHLTHDTYRQFLAGPIGLVAAFYLAFLVPPSGRRVAIRAACFSGVLIGTLTLLEARYGITFGPRLFQAQGVSRAVATLTNPAVLPRDVPRNGCHSRGHDRSFHGAAAPPRRGCAGSCPWAVWLSPTREVRVPSGAVGIGLAWLLAGRSRIALVSAATVVTALVAIIGPSQVLPKDLGAASRQQRNGVRALGRIGGGRPGGA